MNTYTIICQNAGYEYQSSGEDPQDAIMRLIDRQPTRWVGPNRRVAVDGVVYPVSVKLSVVVGDGVSSEDAVQS